MPARLLVIQHEPACPPGWFGEWLTRADLELDVLDAAEGRAIPARLDGYGGLLVLGGRMGAGDDAEHRWLAPTKALIATTVLSGTAFLGICLGHQLAAAALGGEVAPNPRGRTRGLVPFTPTRAARADPLLGGVRPGSPALHHNNDIVTRLPRGPVQVLATAPDGSCQAVRLGPRAWGVQFHPEAGPEIFEVWVRAEQAREREAARAGASGAGRTPDDDGTLVTAQVFGQEAALRRAWGPVARRFAHLVTEAAEAPA